MIITGDAIPNGSKRLLITDKTPRFVNGLSSSDTLKENVSVSRFQYTPKERWVGLVTWLKSRLHKSDAPDARSSIGNALVTLGRLMRSCGAASSLSPTLLGCAEGGRLTLHFRVTISDHRQHKNPVRQILWHRIRTELLLLALFPSGRMLRLLVTMCFQRDALSFGTLSLLRLGGYPCTTEILRNRDVLLLRQNLVCNGA